MSSGRARVHGERSGSHGAAAGGGDAPGPGWSGHAALGRVRAAPTLRRTQK